MQRVLVRLGNEKSSLNAGVFHPREYHFLNFETTNVDITICKAASSEVQVRAATVCVSAQLTCAGMLSTDTVVL